MFTLAVIPARGGSKGFPNKNLLTLAGRPIISYTVDSAKQSDLIDHIVLSTEDSQIADVAKSLGVEVIDRPLDLATDTIPSTCAVAHAVAEFEKKHKMRVDLAVQLYPDHPIRLKGVLDSGIEKLISNNGDSLFWLSVCKSHPCYTVRLDKNKISYAFVKPKEARQLNEKLYDMHPLGDILRRDILLNAEYDPNEPHNFFGKNILGLETNNPVASIENELDLMWVEFLISKGVI